MSRFTGLLLVFITSCLHEKADNFSTIVPCEEVTFSGDIKPIVIMHCTLTGCHIPGFTMGDFTNYDSLKIKIDNGKFFFRVLQSKTMPPLNPLSAQDLENIRCWMDGGAENN